MAEQEKEWQPVDWEGVKTCLVIMAHPDDPDITCGGTATLMAQAGIDVRYMILTNGDKGNHNPEITHEELVLMRQAEQRAAAETCGLGPVIFMGEEDGFLQPTRELRERVVRIIRSLRPEIVICQDPTAYTSGTGYINHPDHRNAGLVAFEAIFPASDNRMFFPEMLDEGFEPHKISQLYITRFSDPNTRIDVSAVAETKIKAVFCHKSQFAEREQQAMRRWMDHWGEENEDGSRTYWEHFQVMRFERRRTDKEVAEEEGGQKADA